MVLVGLSWLVEWLLLDVFNMDSSLAQEVKSVLITAIIFIVIGLLFDYRANYPWIKRQQ